MKIVHVASEISPIAKVGGLADVVYGLSMATAKVGNDVSVIIPAYDYLKKDFFKSKRGRVINAGNDVQYRVLKKKLKSIMIYGIDLITPLFQRDIIYGGADEISFFLHFSKSASHLIQKLNPDIAHGHDWQACYALFDLKKAKSPIKTVLTMHNMQYQGRVSPKELNEIGVSLPLLSWMLDPSDPSYANLLKMGIEAADRLTTVSKSYMNETIEGAHAFGMSKTLIAHKNKFTGILNGIDYQYFNPIKDKKLKFPFPKKALKTAKALKDAKFKNLHHLLEEAQKPYDERFTVCSISRLADQKAPFLILYALKKTIEMGGRFILIGSLHGSDQDDVIIDFLKIYEYHPSVIVELNTNSTMAHLAYAASHAIIVPSLFEPCGLTQMIALRYGAIPMVRSTGGLKDTVFDIDTSELPMEKRNGFTFDYADEKGIDWVLDRCFNLYNKHPDAFWNLSLNNLSINNSWEKSVNEYLDIYTKLSINDAKEYYAEI